MMLRRAFCLAVTACLMAGLVVPARAGVADTPLPSFADGKPAKMVAANLPIADSISSFSQPCVFPIVRIFCARLHTASDEKSSSLYMGSATFICTTDHRQPKSWQQPVCGLLTKAQP